MIWQNQRERPNLTRDVPIPKLFKENPKKSIKKVIIPKKAEASKTGKIENKEGNINIDVSKLTIEEFLDLDLKENTENPNITQNSQTSNSQPQVKSQSEKNKSDLKGSNKLFKPFGMRNNLEPFLPQKLLEKQDSHEIQMNKESLTPFMSVEKREGNKTEEGKKDQKKKDDKEKPEKKKNRGKVDDINKNNNRFSKKNFKNEGNFVRLNLKKKFKERQRGSLNVFKTRFKQNGRLKMTRRLAEQIEKQKQLGGDEGDQELETVNGQIQPRPHPLTKCPYISKNIIPLAQEHERQEYEKNRLKKLYDENKSSENAEEHQSNIDITAEKKAEITPQCQNNENKIDEEIKIPTTDQEYLKILREKFGHKTFRGGQLESLRRIVQGDSTLVVLSTGTGKSLIYQFASYLMKGLTIVVSPLISLMLDQVSKLSPCLTGVCYNASLAPEHKKLILPLIKAGKIKILLMSPEYLQRESFDGFPKINFVCIDEAHCISEWSHNFRTSYFLLASLIEKKFGKVPIVGLTATATLKTQRSVLNILRLSETSIIKAPSVIRENLHISVTRDQDPSRALITLLKSPKFNKFRSIIVYCTTKRTVDGLVHYLNGNGISSVSYHADKTESQRNMIQQGFMNNQYRVVVATVAFGMGIDKPDVRAVIHMNLPRSMENYIQEIGRAGRDGKPAYCHLFLSDDDYFKMRGLMYGEIVERNSVKALMRKILNTEITTYKPKKRNFKDLETEQDITAKIESLEDEERYDFVLATLEKVKNKLLCLRTNELTGETGLKTETVTTMIMEFDKYHDQFFKFKNFGQTSCKVGFYKSKPEDLTEKYPIVEAILECSRVYAGNYKFRLVDVANHLKQDIYDVLKELNRLDFMGELSHEAEDDGYYYMLTRFPNSEEQEDILNSLYSKIKEFELSSISKLDFLYAIMRMYSKAAVETMIKDVRNINFYNIQGDLLEPLNNSIILESNEEEFHLEIAPKKLKLFNFDGGPTMEDLIDKYFSVDSSNFFEVFNIQEEEYEKILGELQPLEDVLPLIRIGPNDREKIILIGQNDIIRLLVDQSKSIITRFEGKKAFETIGIRKICKILQGVNSKETSYYEWHSNPYWNKYYQHDHEELMNCVQDATIEFLRQTEIVEQEKKKIKENSESPKFLEQAETEKMNIESMNDENSKTNLDAEEIQETN